MEKKIEVSTEVYKKVKEWHAKGRKVYSLICANFGCLAEVYTPHDIKKEPLLCPRCRTLGGGHFTVEGTVTPDMLKPKKFKPTNVKLKDIEIEITEPPAWASFLCDGLVNLRVTIRQHWRPIDIPFGLRADTKKEFKRQLKRLEKSIEDKTFFEHDYNWCLISDACYGEGYNLVRGK